MIELVYETARFYRLDPEVEMARPLGLVIEHYDQALRIAREERAAMPA